jgi:hypothetical protein
MSFFIILSKILSNKESYLLVRKTNKEEFFHFYFL